MDEIFVILFWTVRFVYALLKKETKINSNADITQESMTGHFFHNYALSKAFYAEKCPK